jgi:hypothetical protein
VARFLQLRSVVGCSYFAGRYREVLMEGTTNEYDFSSAITFLMVGLGIGSILALVFNPKQRVALDGVNSGSAPGFQPRREVEVVEERVA